MGEEDARVGDQPSPVAGVMCTLAQVADEIKIQSSAAAEAERRALRLDSRTVGCNQHVSGEVVLVTGHQLRQAP